jgi:radical SAM superfamily enzyme YgiQ (UPF0313 family)
MRVLLIQPPLEDFYTTPIRLYPLGLLYAARVLEDFDAEVEILDCLAPLRKTRIPVPPSFSYLPPLSRVPHFFKGYYRFGLADGEILRRIRDFAPDIIGIASQFTAYYQSVEEIARLIKRNFNTPIFIGGNHATVFAAEIRRRTPEIDFVLEGLAEACLPNFLAGLDFGGRAHGAEWTPDPGRANRITPGVDWRKIEPSHHLVQGEDYRIGNINYISLIAGRGCPYGCDFCSVERMFGRDIRYREVDSLIEEMRQNYDRKDARLFNFEDDNLSFDRRWFLRFLGAIESETALKDIELTAMNGLCWNTLDEEVLAAMKRVGFRELNLAMVTRSQELKRRHLRPDSIDSPDKFDRLIATARKLDFFLTVYVIIGLPGQTYAEVKESIDFLLGLGVLVGPSVFYLAPGSRLYEEMEMPPAVKDDWNLYRSSAFAVETADLNRTQLLELFSYVRQKNLEKRALFESSRTVRSIKRAE